MSKSSSFVSDSVIPFSMYRGTKKDTKSSLHTQTVDFYNETNGRNEYIEDRVAIKL